ncbi:hypothetical protein [Brevibacterium sp. UCMA 11754]|nr:hypothetical protein [Brevibacterium sp. UCMA 11754]
MADRRVRRARVDDALWHRTEVTHILDAVSPAVPERMFTINLG